MNLHYFFEVSPAIQIHLVAALGALLIAASIFMVKRGRLAHRTLGVSFAILMAITAGSAIFITGLNGDHWSFIHLFVPLTAIGIFGTLMAMRRRNWSKHKQHARGLIFGALIIPGAFTFLPGRLMHAMFFGI